MGVLHREFSELYNAAVEERSSNLSSLSIQYKDYAAWHNAQLQSEAITPHKEYWLEQFKGDLPVLALPSDNPRPKVMTYNGASVYRELDKSTTEKLKLFSQQQGGTMFMTLQVALNILLYKYTGQEDIVIGSPIAGREHPDLEGQIGFYVNTLALRNQFNKEDSIATLYQKIKQNTLGAYSHQVYPYDELVDSLKLTRDMSRNPLFDVMLVVQSREESETGLGFIHTEIQPYHITSEGYEVAKFDLTFGFEEHSEGIYYSLNYNTDIYSEQQVTRMLGHLEQLLNTLSTQAQTPLTDYDILTKEEKTYLLETLNDTKADYPKDKTIVDLFEEQVAKTPENIAIKFKDTELTYRGLNEKSNQLAHYLITNYAIQSDDLVGIELERSEWMVIGILAIIKAGGAYVPIDPEYPEQRKAFIKADANFKVTINDQELKKFREENKKNEYPSINPNIELYPTWSPDGRYIAFLRQADEKGEPSHLVIIPALGGTEREIGRVDNGLDWSPDGKYLVVTLGSESYGIPVLKVREIIRLCPITPVATMPEHVRGVINLRGKIIPLVDLRTRFGLPVEVDHDRNCIVVAQLAGSAGASRLYGVIVDGVEEVASFTADDIEPTPDFGGAIDVRFITGMAKSESLVTTLIDLDRIAAADMATAAVETLASPPVVSSR
jgi:chemotaxis signal transduction protein